MTMPAITPERAKELIDLGAVLVDVREADEHARQKIPGADHLPLSKLEQAGLAGGGRRPVIFHCRSGARTAANAPRLASKVGEGCDAYIVEGGIDAWRRAGLPVIEDRKQPIEMQRQVQIGAGALVFGGTLLGMFVAPAFYAVPAFVGAGLMMAGITGFCGMARVLVHAPWNRALKRA